ncbi:hypothetical protein [Haloquadratum walsbyi]|jgi:hypothetical protein|uniref:hypothetical protein n=1 Tax=Haloquadratum walsbyi TaxID=293091 RepID=UPI0026CA8A6E|nr:hypothetical protein [Haloquadratum walsbyi]
MRGRGDLQECGTQSAHRTLQQLSGREDEYVKHVLHSVASGIVEEAGEHECDGIIFEDLDGTGFDSEFPMPIGTQCGHSARSHSVSNTKPKGEAYSWIR